MGCQLWLKPAREQTTKASVKTSILFYLVPHPLFSLAFMIAMQQKTPFLIIIKLSKRGLFFLFPHWLKMSKNSQNWKSFKQDSLFMCFGSQFCSVFIIFMLLIYETVSLSKFLRSCVVVGAECEIHLLLFGIVYSCQSVQNSNEKLRLLKKKRFLFTCRPLLAYYYNSSSASEAPPHTNYS